MARRKRWEKKINEKKIGREEKLGRVKGMGEKMFRGFLEVVSIF